MAFFNNLPLVSIALIISSTCISASAETESNSKGFSTNLIHIDSPFIRYRNGRVESFARGAKCYSSGGWNFGESFPRSVGWNGFGESFPRSGRWNGSGESFPRSGGWNDSGESFLRGGTYRRGASFAEDSSLKNTLSRCTHLVARQQKQPHDFVSPHISDRIAFLANLSIGDPPVNVYVDVDTGSDLLWIQCAPCDVCYDQPDPLYDRTKSDSFTEMACDTPLCLSLGRGAKCSNEAELYCAYNYAYADGTMSSGVLAFETLTFTSRYSILNKTAYVGFGCGFNNMINIEGYRDGGVLGLGPGPLSLVSQLSSGGSPKIFGYCFGNMSDPSSVGYLSFGDPAYLDGYTTPMVVDEFYYINLRGIGLGIERPRLLIRSSYFKRSEDGSGGVIMDSGTTVNIFLPAVYEVVEEAVLEELDQQYNITPSYIGHGRVCFDGRIERDLNYFPSLVLYLEGTVILQDRWGIFQQINDTMFCLGFVSGEDLNIIGTIFQQFYRFGYDLVNNTLSIQPVGKCT